MLQEPMPDGYQGGDVGSSSVPTKRSIFRAEALQRYKENQDKVVLPRLISSRVFGFLWILATLLLVTGLIVAFWPLIEQSL